jgi:hypothetical protein
MACATFMETNWHISDLDRTNPVKLLELRVLERHDGRWNITHLIFVPVRNTTHDHAHIRVDASGRVMHSARGANYAERAVCAREPICRCRAPLPSRRNAAQTAARAWFSAGPTTGSFPSVS